MKISKKKIATILGSGILNKPVLEKILRCLSSQPFIRKNFKISAIPMSYAYNLKQREIRKAEVGSYKINVNIAEASGVSLYFFGEHNEPFSAWLASDIVNIGDVCVDVGANIGSYAFLMANSAGIDGKIFAFEPNPELSSLLIDSVKTNKADKFILVDNRALYKKSEKKIKFFLSDNPSNTGTSSLVNHGVFVKDEHWIEIETATLTDFFKEKAIEKCKIVKIDVERAELEVLQGGIELLEEQRIDYIILEQLAGGEAQQLLESCNYEGWWIDEKRRKLTAINEIEVGLFGNYLFASPKVVLNFRQVYKSFFS